MLHISRKCLVPGREQQFSDLPTVYKWSFALSKVVPPPEVPLKLQIEKFKSFSSPNEVWGFFHGWWCHFLENRLVSRQWFHTYWSPIWNLTCSGADYGILLLYYLWFYDWFLSLIEMSAFSDLQCGSWWSWLVGSCGRLCTTPLSRPPEKHHTWRQHSGPPGCKDPPNPALSPAHALQVS